MSERPQFLMAEPTHYDVAYEINPWMKPALWAAAAGPNRHAAEQAWSSLKSGLERCGAEVHAMPGAPGVPDLVFPANAAVVLDGKALLARFRHPERAAEEPHYRRALQALAASGVISEVIPAGPGFQEGAGDCLWDRARRIFWVGSGPRSSAESCAVIAEAFGREVAHLPLATDRYYHLDTCFCPLSGGEILYYPPALTHEAKAALFAHTRGDERMEAEDADAEAFSVNAVCLGRTVLMARPPERLKARLAERGYDVVGLHLAPFLLSGGGAFCMTLRLDLRSASAIMPRALAAA
jgi:N-dimethylarginine dimethylaminohydrolase